MSDTIANMTDEPAKDPSDQPTEDADSTTTPPATPPSEPSGVGFAAIRLPGQQPPSQPLPGQAPGYANPYQPPATPQGIPPAASPPPPGPPPPPDPVYQYDISRMPPSRGGGPSVLLVGGIAFLLVLLVGVGGMFALGVGPFARATPRPTATLVAQPTPIVTTATPRPTTETAAPVATPTDGGAPTLEPTEALLSHIPSQIADSCLVTAPDDPGAILAIAVCDADGGDIRVSYFQYDAHESMFSAYSGFRIASQIEPDSGDCDDPATWPTENSYDIGGVTAGRLLCTEELSETSLYWTDERLNILSQATHTKGDHERLVEFWTSESGPDL